MPVFFLAEEILFPPPQLASKEGLLAVGGDLSPKRLLRAYSLGIFPWFANEDPIMWWSPDPRLVLYPEEMRISKSLNKVMKKGIFHVTMDTAFIQVINSCAQVRVENGEDTWIVEDMIKAYCELHELGFAHSVEAWCEGTLAGGLYGLSLGRCFFGESMFTNVSNASKVGFVTLVEYLKRLSFHMIDCQVTTDHLIRFGAREIPRVQFLQELEIALDAPTKMGRWLLNDEKMIGLRETSSIQRSFYSG